MAITTIDIQHIVSVQSQRLIFADFDLLVLVATDETGLETRLNLYFRSGAMPTIQQLPDREVP